MAPLADLQGSVIGVIRCVNKHAERTPHEVNMFSESDLAVIDTVEQAMVPHLLVLLAEERRAKRLGRLTHELRAPMTAIRAAVDFIGVDVQRGDYSLCVTHVAELLAWHALASQLLDNVDFFRYRVEGSKPTVEKMALADVLHQTRVPLGPLLRDRKFPDITPSLEGDSLLPPLYVDPRQFQQVFFNLLANAVKFAKDDPSDFCVELTAREATGGYEIIFRDWGKGIPEECGDLVFGEGFRGPDAEQYHVSGSGIGLWVVAEVIKAHHGSVRISSYVNPTEIVISLPRLIAEPWSP